MIALIPGHGAKPGWDPGAVLGETTEAARNQALCEAALAAASAAGHEARIFASGPYPDRVVKVASWIGGEQGLILHVHHDCHGGQGRMVLHHRDSVMGASAADAVVLAMPVPCRVVPAFDDRPSAGSRAWLFNSAYLCGLAWHYPRICAVVLEVLTMDVPTDLDVTVGAALGGM